MTQKDTCLKEWRIYYDDGSTFDDSMGEPEHAPSFGVVVIIGYDEEGERMLLHKWNYYWTKDLKGRAIWYGSDNIGLIDQLAHDRDRNVHGLKIGRTISNSDYRNFLGIAAYDSDFPKTTRKVFRSSPQDLT